MRVSKKLRRFWNSFTLIVKISVMSTILQIGNITIYTLSGTSGIQAIIAGFLVGIASVFLIRRAIRKEKKARKK